MKTSIPLSPSLPPKDSGETQQSPEDTILPCGSRNLYKGLRECLGYNHIVDFAYLLFHLFLNDTNETAGS